jgi:hypothetical protein
LTSVVLHDSYPFRSAAADYHSSAIYVLGFIGVCS